MSALSRLEVDAVRRIITRKTNRLKQKKLRREAIDGSAVVLFQLGPMDSKCSFCDALMFRNETKKRLMSV